MVFLPQSKFGIEKSEWESNPIPYPEHKYFAGSTFLVILKFPIKQYFRVNSAFKSS